MTSDRPLRSPDHDDDGTDAVLAPLLGKVADEMAERLKSDGRVRLDEFIEQYPQLAGVLPDVYASLLGLQGLVADNGEPQVQESQLLELGDYQLVREIGRGGMGVVYEAKQHSLRRLVAVKVFPFASVLEPNKLQRFKNEAFAAATLEHPHIVPVIAVGCECNTHFYVMRLIRGASFARLIRDFHTSDEGDHERDSKNAGTKPVANQSTIHSRSSSRRQKYQKQIATWIRDAATALHYAHNLGIVHRDIKPANLLIDEQQKVWVTDFGLATGIVNTTLTATGEVLGTLPYMSPEQTAGDRQFVDHRTDIYSLGATLFEALTGRKPFTSSNRASLIREIADEEPRIESRLRRLLSADLANITIKAMAKDPTDRYATAQELADDLSRYLAGSPILARRPSRLNRTIRWVARNRTVTVATAIVIACLMLVAFQAQLSYRRIWLSSEKLKRHLHLADVRLASEAIENNNIVQARELLSRSLPTAGERDLRGFAWHSLWERAHPAGLVFHGHNSSVHSVDWSPNRHEVVSADESGQLLVWNPTSGEVLRRFDPWSAEITCVRYAPSGESIALVDKDGRLALMDRQTGSVLRSVTIHKDRARKVTFAPDGERIATCGEDGVISVTETATLNECFRVSAHGYRAYDIEFYSEGTRLVSVGSDHTLQTWRVNDRGLIRDSSITLEGRNGTRGFTIASGEPWLILNSGNGWLRKFDLNNLKELNSWKVAAERLYEIRLFPDGKDLIVTGKDRLSRIVDVATGEVRRSLVGHGKRVYAACHSPTGEHVVTASADGSCRVFPTASSLGTTLERIDAGPGLAVELSANGDQVAFCDRRGNWLLREYSTGVKTHLPGRHVSDVGTTLDFSLSGDTLATSGSPFIALARQNSNDLSPVSFRFDLDCDGDKDLVATIGTDARLVFQESLPGGTLGPVRLLPLRQNRMPRVNVRSLDQQGWEFTPGHTASGLLRQYIRSGKSPVEIRETRLESSGDCTVALVGDLDGSGGQEMLVAEHLKATLSLRTETSSGMQIRTTSIPADLPVGLVAMDVDEDGLRDVIAVRSQRGVIEWYRQISPLEFGIGTRIADMPREPGLAFLEDVDNDSNLDLVVITEQQSLWLRRSEPRVFTNAEPFTKSLHEMKSIVPPIVDTAVWDTESCNVRTTLRAIQHHANRIALSPNGKALASYGDDGIVRLRNCDTGEQFSFVALENSDIVNSLEYSPNGKILAIANGDECLLWCVETESIAASLRGHESTVRRVCFSSSGELIATLSHDLTVGLWATSTGTQRRVLLGFQDRPFCACFSPDDETIAVGTLDGRIQMWDVDSGQELCVLADFKGQEVLAISFRGPMELLAVVYDKANGIARLKSFKPGLDIDLPK